MKKWMFLSLLLGAMSLQAVAQDDDMYFVGSSRQRDAGRNGNAGYSGSQRSVDDYNRRGSYYVVLPADTGDVITFSGGMGVYPADSVGDFAITQHMQRWDNYTPSDAYWDGYSQGRRDSWGWHSPWLYSHSYYPWYDSWYYDSWYYDPWYWRYSSWYDPWYSWGWGGYYSSWYYRPWHYYGSWYGGGGGIGHHYTYGNGTGTIDRYGRTGGSFGGYRGNTNSARFGRASGRTVNGHTNYGTGNRTRTNTSGSGNFSGSRSSGSSYGGNSGGNSSFGGSRSSAGSRSSGSSGYSGGGFSGGGGSRSSGGGGGFSGGGGSRSSGGGGGGGRSGGSRR
jgi:hypothetical protein